MTTTSTSQTPAAQEAHLQSGHSKVPEGRARSAPPPDGPGTVRTHDDGAAGSGVR